MDGGNLASKSIIWIFSGNLYPADSRQVKSLVTLLRDSIGCEDWATFMSRSSLNSANMPEIPEVVYSALRAVMSSAAVPLSWNLPFRKSKRQSLMEPTMVDVMQDVPLWTLRTGVALRRHSRRVATSQKQQVQRIKGFLWGSRDERNSLKVTRNLRTRTHKGYAGFHRTSVKIQGAKGTLHKLGMCHHGNAKNVGE